MKEQYLSLYLVKIEERPKRTGRVDTGIRRKFLQDKRPGQYVLALFVVLSLMAIDVYIYSKLKEVLQRSSEKSMR